MLKSDSKGFLVGDPIDIKKTLDIWQSVRNDIKDIKSRIFGDGKGITLTANVKMPSQAGAIKRATERQKQPSAAIPLPRQSKSNRERYGSPLDDNLFIDKLLSRTTATPATRKKSFAPKRADSSTPDRDAKGRFI
ncbi:hypothetical protein, partial [Nitrosomonas sp.]|uniref:hypothetical protein n=1 Tax=Nitrosomonas sp. TaxID=42353 RepID=UPI001D8EAC0F